MAPGRPYLSAFYERSTIGHKFSLQIIIRVAGLGIFSFWNSYLLDIGMLGEFFEWWGGELAALIPERMRQWFAAAPQYHVIPLSAGLGKTLPAMKKPGRLLVGLEPRHVLEKHLTLPLAAERELDRILAYEMDRETPFDENEVYWRGFVTARNRARGQIAVRLVLVKRSLPARLLQRLGEAGTGAAGLLVGSAAPYEIPLSHAVPSATARFLRIANVPALGCAALVLLAIATPFIRQSLAFADIDRRIDAVTPVAEQVAALKSRLSGTGADAVIDSQRAALGDPLGLLAAVTDALPDDTFLDTITMHRRQVSLSGQSSAAAALIPRLAADKAFREPGFSAPVTRTPGSAEDSFTIAVSFAAP
jgi:general secretion pathway protein L